MKLSHADIIAKNYAEAVKGIESDWFQSANPKWYDYIMKLPLRLRVTYLVVIMHNQIFNGGFHQYFANGYGQFARETIDALIEIGAMRKAELLQAALEKVNADDDTDAIFRQRLLKRDIKPLFVYDDLFKPLKALNDQYDDIDEEEDIEQLLGNYLQRFSPPF